MKKQSNNNKNHSNVYLSTYGLHYQVKIESVYIICETENRLTPCSIVKQKRVLLTLTLNSLKDDI